MKLTLYYYLFYVCLGSGFILSLFTIMAYMNCIGLKIKKGKNFRSGTILLTNTILYFIFGFYVNQLIKKEEELRNKKKENLSLFEMPELPSIN